MLKHWLPIGSIAFGVSFACALPFNRDLTQSALIGLASIPGAIACTSVRLRQRQQHVNRQLGSEISRLQGLRQQSATVDRQLQLTLKDRQSIDERVRQLNSLATSLTERIDRVDRDRIQLEQQLAISTIYCEEQDSIIIKLDLKISDKRALLLEVEGQLFEIKSQLHYAELELGKQQSKLEYLATQLITKTNEIAISDRRLQAIHTDLVARQVELTNLASQLHTHVDEFDDRELVNLRLQLNAIESTYSKKQSDLVNLESQLLAKIADIESSDRNLQITQAEISDRQTELASLESQLQAKITTASQINIVALQSQLNSIELQSREKQEILADLESQLVGKINEIAANNHSLELIQLELGDRRSELAELEAKIYAKLEEMDDVELDLEIAMQRIEPQPPQTSRSIEALLKHDEWHHNFIDNPHLEILQHIEKHGAIAEAELNHKLGNPRSVRQFANKLEEYARYLPFTIRVESSPQGNRYLRDSQN